MATETLVDIRNLSKQYGKFTALQDLTLTIERGAIYGFIGPNGAGKTTTMRILATLLEPTSGDAWVAGHPISGDPRPVRASIGYMPDFFGVYDNMKVWEYLDFFAASYQVPAARRPALITDLLTLVDLGTKRENFVEELSRGMKQRLALARTLVHDPDLLILDEPASGLDPRARIELRELLKELRLLGKTILISSHILTELAEMCTHIGIIERGHLLVSGEVAAILQRLQPTRSLLVRVLGRGAQALALIQQLPGVQEATWIPPVSATGPGPLPGPGPAPGPGVPLPEGPLTLRVRMTGDERLFSALLAGLVRAEVPVYSFQEEVSDLEDIFLRITRGLVQ
jgi:ABC-2 type transport system ATP-binding protein